MILLFILGVVFVIATATFCVTAFALWNWDYDETKAGLFIAAVMIPFTAWVTWAAVLGVRALGADL